jgi:hypothetical protein
MPIWQALFLKKAPYELYERILEYIRWSDRADFWAFFHQCWNLLPLSYHLKLKYPNHILQGYEKPDTIPGLQELVYTQVLTKQSALFNSWKEMNRVSNDEKIPFRCVSQWATYQTGKLKETLGLPLLPLVPLQPLQPPLSQGGPPVSGLSPLVGPLSEPASAPARRKVVVKKKAGGPLSALGLGSS